MAPRMLNWPSNPSYERTAEDIGYFEANPV
jgi:hypothetical protein